MKSIEKIAFLRGLIEGSDLQLEKKEQKILDALLDALSSMEEEIAETQNQVQDLDEVVTDLFETIREATEEMSSYYDDFDDDSFEIDCPSCSAAVFFDEDDLEDGSTVCFSCGHIIDLSLAFEDDDED